MGTMLVFGSAKIGKKFNSAIFLGKILQFVLIRQQHELFEKHYKIEKIGGVGNVLYVCGS